ncbi:SLC13 family permease [Micrococcus yunnanensis]|uniref:SLC13 family permease n=1 Tax=Micrococcus yunnanensis TaxID=566027 RepID=UPI00398EA9CB
MMATPGETGTPRPHGSTRLRKAAQQRIHLRRQASEEKAVVDSAQAGTEHRTPDSFLSHLHLRPAWFGLAVLALVAVLLAPGLQEAGLSVAGQRALAILVFAVILWVTEAVSYPVSSVAIIGLIALLIGFSPDPEAPQKSLGTNGGLGYALEGFSAAAVALVAGALVLAAAMQATGLHKRVALLVLKFAGEKTSRILIGVIVITVILSFFVPSATARAGAVVPILLGLVAAFGLPKDSKLSALFIITAAQAISIWNIGIMTAAAQNQVAVGFIREEMGREISWPEWFLWGAPWSAVMSVVLYLVMRWAIRPELTRLEGGREVVGRDLAALGPMTGKEIRLTVVALLLLLAWSTQGILHPVDATTVTLVAVAVLLMPRVGVFSWKTVEGLVNWGTLVVFAVGISLGSLLLKTGAASWLSERVFDSLGVAHMPLLAMIALVSAFTILIHLGFASATALSSALIPVFIAFSMTIPNAAQGGLGFVIVQQFVICFGFLLPVSAPQNMLAYGTGAFTAKQFLKTGIPITVIGYLMVLLFSATYWRWIGLL